MNNLRKLLQQARTAIAQGRHEDAAAIYEGILAQDGMADDLDMLLRYARCCEQAGQTDAAIKAYGDVIQQYEKLNESSAIEQLRKIVDMLKPPPPAEIIETIEAIETVKPTSNKNKCRISFDSFSEEELLQMAKKASEQEAYEEAAHLYEEALTRDGMIGKLEIQLRLAWCNEKTGHIDGACELYRDVIQQYEDMNEDQAAEKLRHTLNSLERSAKPFFRRPSAPISETGLVDELMKMGEIIHLEPKQVLCEAGGEPHTLWLLCKGALRFKMKDYADVPDIVYTDETGVVLVGELGVFTQQPRSATVWSEQYADLYAVSASDIRKRREIDAEFNDAMDRLIREKWVTPIISRHALFDRVNEIHRKKIMQKFMPVEFQAGECLVDLDAVHNACYLVQIGCVFFLDTAQGDQTKPMSLLANAMPGDLIHTGGLMKDFKSPCRIVAATNVRLFRLSQEDFEPFTRDRPWLIQTLVHLSRRPSHQQVLHPEEDYLWMTNRTITLNRVGTRKEEW